MPSSESRAAWILVGGQSRRMGLDKALLEVRGRPLVLGIAEILTSVCNSIGLVGDPQKYGFLGLPIVPDNFPGEGPLGGIETALGASQVDLNLIVGCDMPKLDVKVIEQLFSMDADCAVPRHEDGRVEPLCAVYHRRCHDAILEVFRQGTRRITDALQALDSLGFAVRYLRVASEDVFANLNTPDEFRHYTDG